MKTAVTVLESACKRLIENHNRLEALQERLNEQTERNTQELHECQSALNLLYQTLSQSTLKPETVTELHLNFGDQISEHSQPLSAGSGALESLDMSLANLKKVSENNFESLKDLGYLS